MKCVVCNGFLEEVFSLGKMHVSNFIRMEERSKDYPTSDLTMLACPRCGTGQLKEIIDPSTLYKRYWYRSGISELIKKDLKDIVNSCTQSVTLNQGDVWVDIGCNDFTLLRNTPKYCIKVGVDPSDVAAQSYTELDGIFINDFFCKQAYNSNWQLANKGAKIVTAVAMFYDLADPHQFLDDVYDILTDDGLFVIQMSYSPIMCFQSELGNLVSEHIMYYSLDGLQYLLNQHDFSVVDCELTDTNGGSFRVYCTKSNHTHVFRNPQQRDVAMFRVYSLLVHEWISKDRISMFRTFADKINALKDQTVSFLKQEKSQGKNIYGYAASTKSSTFLNYCGLDSTIVSKIADRNPDKHGLKMVGSDIPIVSEEEMRRDNPDYLLVLAWHLRDQFIEREQEYLKGGGKMIFPNPKFEVFSLNGN